MVFLTLPPSCKITFYLTPLPPFVIKTHFLPVFVLKKNLTKFIIKILSELLLLLQICTAVMCYHNICDRMFYSYLLEAGDMPSSVHRLMSQ